MIMAGGDGSLMLLMLMAKDAGCDVSTLVCCVLPYGTGNDLARTLNWGGSENDLKIYKSLPKLVREICLNSDEKDLNVWSIKVNYRANGTTLEINSKTRNYEAHNKPEFERYMVNYWSMGEDARVGTGFEKNRTKNRLCNQCVYAYLGLYNWICASCCCRRPPLITEQLEYVRTLKGKQVKP
jgi:diacylglycerol kinase (ATP)